MKEQGVCSRVADPGFSKPNNRIKQTHLQGPCVCVWVNWAMICVHHRHRQATHLPPKHSSGLLDARQTVSSFLAAPYRLSSVVDYRGQTRPMHSSTAVTNDTPHPVCCLIVHSGRASSNPTVQQTTKSDPEIHLRPRRVCVWPSQVDRKRQEDQKRAAEAALPVVGADGVVSRGEEAGDVRAFARRQGLDAEVRDGDNVMAWGILEGDPEKVSEESSFLVGCCLVMTHEWTQQVCQVFTGILVWHDGHTGASSCW